MPNMFFDLEIGSNVRLADLAWIDGEDAEDGSGLGCNRDYVDLRGATWDEVDRVLGIERRLIASQTASTELMEMREDLIQDAAKFDLLDLDLGVASATLALSAAGCIPFTSCNGGAFGGVHSEEYPLVAFYLPQSAVDQVERAARRSGVGLHHDQQGLVHVYAPFLSRMVMFAASLRNSGRRADRKREGLSLEPAHRADQHEQSAQG